MSFVKFIANCQSKEQPAHLVNSPEKVVLNIEIFENPYCISQRFLLIVIYKYR